MGHLIHLLAHGRLDDLQSEEKEIRREEKESIMSLLAAAMSEFQVHPHAIDKFCEMLSPELIAEALEATGTASIRRRKLPAEQIVWLTVGMALFSNTSIRQVLDRLNLTVNGKVVPSSISDARKRLGPKPLLYLFDLLARSWTAQLTPESHWRGMRLFGVDGTSMRVPDSDENLSHFGRPGSHRSEAAYPHVRVVAAMDLGQRLVYSAKTGPLAQGERTMAASLLEDLPSDSLCLTDRGLASYMNFPRMSAPSSRKNYLCRVRSEMKFTAQEELSDGSILATIKPSWKLKNENPELPDNLVVRIIDYNVEGHLPIRLFTSLLDEKKYPRRDLATLYHERWEIEVAFDELKTDMLNRKEALRSQSVAGVEQEVWSILLTYNLVRREMALTALAHSAKPSVMSFKASMLFIHDFFISHSSDPATGRLPERLRALREELWRYRLPPRRSERSAPRHVKIKMSNYPKKPPRTA